MRTASRNRRLLWRGGVALFSRPCNGAFTMVEMLAVLMILTILVALAVGVGVIVMAETKRKQTIATQQVVMEALQAYHDNNNKYPDEDTDGSDDCSEVMTKLLGDVDGKVFVKGLSSEAYVSGINTPLLDAYGAAMRYRRNGGLGGGPVLISAGKDSEFGFGDDGLPDTPDDEPDLKLDNIRSDGR